MRPRATRRTDWAQLGLGACALLLPPLALGAALYSMLAPDDATTRPAEAGAVLSEDSGRPAPPVTTTGLPATSSGAAAAGPQLAGPFVDGRARLDQAPAMSIPAVPAVAVNPTAYAEGAVGPPPAENPPATAAPKRRNAQRQQPQQPQQQDFVKTWLQHIGLLPPYR